MENRDIRWKQRFANFKKALHLLEKAILIKHPSEIERAGLVQFFELSFELSWNLMKDYLEEIGYSDVKSPRDSIKKAFEIELISDGYSWLEALKNRNETSHIYDEATAEKVIFEIINSYLPLLKNLELTLDLKV